jgi:DNA-binding response OmpR family regulator
MMDTNVRILVIDGCQLNAWLVGRLAPPGVNIEQVQSFEGAREVLTTNPPDAVILNVTPCELPWGQLADLCRNHEPPIPYLLCSTVFDDSELAPADHGPGVSYCYKPVSVPHMRRQIEALVTRARGGSELALEDPEGTNFTPQTPVV